jgi:hypothetical protein
MGPPSEENNKYWEELYQGKAGYPLNYSLMGMLIVV